jgi:hypothetical protein
MQDRDRTADTVATTLERAVAPATMAGLLLFVAVVLGGVLALTVVTA